MIHLFLAVPLLASPPGLVERLQLAAAPSEELSYRLTPREAAAGAGGALLGEALTLAVLFDSNRAPFMTCSGDVCGVSPMLYVSLLASELLAVPLSAALFADWASPDPLADFGRAWGFATLAHLGGLLLTIPAFAVGGSHEVLAVALLITGMILDAGVTGLVAGLELHDAPPPAPPPPAVLPPEPHPMDEPPPHAGNALVIPLAFAF